MSMMPTILYQANHWGVISILPTIFLNSLCLFDPWAVFQHLGLAPGVAIFSKSTAHGHFLENLASDLFNLVNDAPDFPTT
jgi:hypothetical protein